MAQRRTKSTKKRRSPKKRARSSARGTQVVVVRANPTANPSRKRRRTRTRRRANPTANPSRKRRVRRRRNPDMGPVGKGLAVAGVAALAGLGVMAFMPKALEQASPRIVGAGLMAAGIGGAMLAQRYPIPGYALAAVGGGIGLPIVAGTFGLTYDPNNATQSPALQGLAMGAVEQAVSAIGHGQGSEVYRTPLPSSAQLGWLS